MKRFFCLAICFALCSCAAPTQFLVKQYEPAKLDGTGIVIYPLSAGQISVLSMDDFKDDFEDVKTAPGDFFKGEIAAASAKYFEANFKQVKVEDGLDNSVAPLGPDNSEKVTEKIGQDNFEIRIPKREYLEQHHAKPRFVLVMDQVAFSRNMEAVQHMMPGAQAPSVNMGGKTMSAPAAAPMSVTTNKMSIGIALNYAIYDYEEKAVVGYGQAKGEKGFNFAMTRSDWYAAMDDVFSNIKKYSPF